MLIRTARLIIRPLERVDVDALQALRPHTDPLLARYNVPAETEQERDRWFALRTGDPTRQEFAILASGQLVGRIGLRDINGQGSARLGIGLGADFLDQGLGAEALAGFLAWYFGEGGWSKIVLDVLTANARAVRVYEKLGFRCVAQRREPADESTVAFLHDPRSDPLRHFFPYEDGKYWVVFYEMELTREMRL